MLTPLLIENRRDLGLRRDVERGGRFIGEKQLGPTGKGARDQREVLGSTATQCLAARSSEILPVELGRPARAA